MSVVKTGKGRGEGGVVDRVRGIVRAWVERDQRDVQAAGSRMLEIERAVGVGEDSAKAVRACPRCGYDGPDARTQTGACFDAYGCVERQREKRSANPRAEATYGPKADCENCNGTGTWHNIVFDEETCCPCVNGEAMKKDHAEPGRGYAAEEIHDLREAAKMAHEAWTCAPDAISTRACMDRLEAVARLGLMVDDYSAGAPRPETGMPALTDLEKREAEHTRQVLLFAAEKALLVKIVEAAEAYVEAPTLRTLLGQTVSETDNWAARRRLREAVKTWRGMHEKGAEK